MGEPRMGEGEVRRAAEVFMADRGIPFLSMTGMTYGDAAFVSEFRAGLPSFVAPEKLAEMDRRAVERLFGHWQIGYTRTVGLLWRVRCFVRRRSWAARHVFLDVEDATGVVTRVM